jgi:WD40 repeat protein
LGFVRFRPGTNQLAIGLEDSIRFFETAGLDIKPLKEIQARASAASGCFDRVGKLLAVSYAETGGIDLFDAETGQKYPPDVRVSGGWDLAVGRDGQMLAGLRWGEPSLHVWDLKKQQCMHRIEHPRGSQSEQAIAVLPHQRIMATSYRDSSILLWDVESGQLIRTLEGHTAGVGTLQFSPDGRRLLSGSYDHSVRLWDWQLGCELLRLPNMHYVVHQATFSPDGLNIANTDSGPSAWVRRALPWSGQQEAPKLGQPSPK